MTGLLDEIGVCPATLLTDPMQAGPEELRTAIEAAAAAGDSSLSLWSFQAGAYGLDDLAGLVADVGLRTGAVEAALGWAGGPSPAARTEAEGLIDAAQRLGAGLVMAVTMEPAIDRGAAAEGLAELAGLAEAAGLRVAVEFLPWSGIPTLAAADDLVTASGSSAAGVVLDCWHWQRQPGGPDVERLRTLPGERIAYLQLCDAAPTSAADGDLYGEAMTARRLPGDGEVDLTGPTGLLTVLDAIGARPFVASEVFSSELASLGPAAAARRIHDACAALRGTPIGRR